MTFFYGTTCLQNFIHNYMFSLVACIRGLLPVTDCVCGFRGAIRVTMDLLKLDVTQCPNEYYVQNAFKDTHRCDRKTSYVSNVSPCLNRYL